ALPSGRRALPERPPRPRRNRRRPRGPLSPYARHAGGSVIVNGAAPVLELSNVTREFGTPDGILHAVDGVDLTLCQGETLGVVGESGCGKSTLARLALKLLPVTAGRILLLGQDITHLDERGMRPRRRDIQAVFQDPMSSLNP